MMCRNFLIIILLIAVCVPVSAQKNIYTTTGGEWILSGASVQFPGAEANDVIRFSPVFNFQSQAHRDFSDKAGMFTGLGIRNVGFIYDHPNQANTRYKARTYNIGIPIALKFGDMTGTYFFGGYEIEFPINYKEKKFVNEDKVEKDDYWFSSKVPSVYHTLFFGIQMRDGIQWKFKYYLTGFYNRDYQAVDASGNFYKPYDFEAHVFYVSLSFQILKGTSFYYNHKSD